MTLATGSLLAGRYEITAPIAVGGMGEVWKARDQVLDRTVAAKVLKSEYTDDPSFLARFRNEARHTAALSHPNIASVYDYGETVDDTGHKKLAFLVMEFVEGQPLVTILHEEGKLPVDWTLHVLEQSADGLSAAHRAGVVHRDIKPGNLMVRPDGVVKLTDFGIAQARDATPLTRTGMVVGTAQYLSPEQAQGLEVNAASDVYSLGIVAYECLTGGRPFDGTSQVAIALAHINRQPPPLPPEVPPAVRLLVERALAKDPADRFPDGGAFADAVRRVAAGGTPTPLAVPVGPFTAPTQVVGDGFADGKTTVLAAQTGALTGTRAISPATGPAGPMPPLQGPEDDDDWLADDAGPARRSAAAGRGSWPALLLLMLLGGGAVAAAQPGRRRRRRRQHRRSDHHLEQLQRAGGRHPDRCRRAPTSAATPTRWRPSWRRWTCGVIEEAADDALLAELGLELDENAVADIVPAGTTVRRGSEITLRSSPRTAGRSRRRSRRRRSRPRPRDAGADRPHHHGGTDHDVVVLVDLDAARRPLDAAPSTSVTQPSPTDAARLAGSVDRSPSRAEPAPSRSRRGARRRWGRCCGCDRVTWSTPAGYPGRRRPAVRLAVGVLPAARPGRCPRAAVRPRTTHAPVREDHR